MGNVNNSADSEMLLTTNQIYLQYMPYHILFFFLFTTTFLCSKQVRRWGRGSSLTSSWPCHVDLTHGASDSQITPTADRRPAWYSAMAIDRRQWGCIPKKSHVQRLCSCGYWNIIFKLKYDYDDAMIEKKNTQNICAETEECETLAFDTNQCSAHPVHNKGSSEWETSKRTSSWAVSVEIYRYLPQINAAILSWHSNWYACQEFIQEADEPRNGQIRIALIYSYHTLSDFFNIFTCSLIRLWLYSTYQYSQFDHGVTLSNAMSTIFHECILMAAVFTLYLW